VILVTLPFGGPGGQKDRPAIVLSTDVYHEEWDEVLVVALTSQAPRKLRATDYELQDWQAGGLHYPS
jgi:mRNA interferase MazF